MSLHWFNPIHCFVGCRTFPFCDSSLDSFPFLTLCLGPDAWGVTRSTFFDLFRPWMFDNNLDTLFSKHHYCCDDTHPPQPTTTESVLCSFWSGCLLLTSYFKLKASHDQQQNTLFTKHHTPFRCWGGFSLCSLVRTQTVRHSLKHKATRLAGAGLCSLQSHACNSP